MRIFPPAGDISVSSALKGTRIDPEPCKPGTAPVGTKIEGAIALVLGDIHSGPPVVRIHSQCLTGDVFGSLRCDCRLQLELALRRSLRPARASCSMSSRRAEASG